MPAKDATTEVRFPSKCCVCDDPARFHPVVKVWAKDYPRSSAPLVVEIGMTYCFAHKGEFKLSDIPNLNSLVLAVCRSAKVVKPDLKSAEIEMRPFFSELE